MPQANEDFSLDDIKIHSAEVVDKPLAVSPYTQPAEIIVDAQAWHQMNQHAREDLRYEAGGVMLGGIYEHDGALVVRITTAVAARGAVNSVASIQFTYDAWSQMEKERQQRAPTEKLVGWYHTHPGFSAFFSSTDRFMHESFFTQPWHVALVIDPINGEHRFYRWDGGGVHEATEFLLQVTHWPGPQPPVRSVLSTNLRQAIQQLEQSKDGGATTLAPALHKLIGSLHSGLSAHPLQDLLPFIVACSELPPEALTEARRTIQESRPPDSAIRFADLATASNNQNAEGAISIAYGWLAQQVDRHHLHLHGLDDSQRFCQELALPFAIHDLTIDEKGYVLTLTHGQDQPLHRLEPALPLLRGSSHASRRSQGEQSLRPLAVDWQGHEPAGRIGKILAGHQQLFLLTKSELLVLASQGPLSSPRFACTDVHAAAACGWTSFSNLTSWTVDPTGNLYLLGAEAKEVWKLDRLAGRWTSFIRDAELDDPTSVAAGMSALSIYDSRKRRIVQYSIADGRLLCRRPLDEEARRFRIWHLFSDGYQRLYLVTDEYILQTL
jgi:proteasome lid subunit RPN8/RPN11